ncbi:type II toxin-antitoxin system HicA family toxin [Rhizobium grahamii]|uniref:Type II toxin-antitoxin system HicA family toxin n=1 Tax=Rhizobium grahamii TaxID=1120045 RepID=A0A370KEG2_9HYPH|nr:type II toxin-antitoxin system HicA family toxin [Rhizobium grahamii]RDJ01436.1 hypothetical protein B5K06_33955 [Rhizobium grahamii]
MFKKLTSKQLDKLLIGFGFEKRPSRGGGGHLLYVHPNVGTAITLPATKADIRPIFAQNALRLILNSGIATQDQLQEKISKL